MMLPKDEDYREAGFAGRLGLGRKPALLVIDMVMAYFDRTSPMYAGVEALIESNVQLIATANRHNVPVIFTRQFYEDRPEDRVYARKVPALRLLAPEAPLTQIEPTLDVE